MSPLITIHHFMVGQNPWRIQFQIYMVRCSGTHKFNSWESMWGCVQHVACSTRDLSICSNNRVVIKIFLLVNSSASSGAHLLISPNRANIQFSESSVYRNHLCELRDFRFKTNGDVRWHVSPDFFIYSIEQGRWGNGPFWMLLRRFWRYPPRIRYRVFEPPKS